MIRWWRGSDRPTRVLATVATLACAIALAGAGLVTWMAVDPEYWIPGAFAEKGERGDPGPTGPRGPRGQPGPVGPSAEGAINQLEGSVFDLENDISSLDSRLGDVESGVEDTFGSGINADLEELKSSAYDLCQDLEFAFDIRLQCILRFF